MSRGSKTFWNILLAYSLPPVFFPFPKEGKGDDGHLLPWQENAEVEKLLHNYKQSILIIPSSFKKLDGALLSLQDCLSLLCVLAPENERLRQRKSERGKLGNHSPKEKAEEPVQAMSASKMFLRDICCSRTCSSHYWLRRYTGSPTLTVPGFSREKYCPKRGSFPYNGCSEGSHSR